MLCAANLIQLTYWQPMSLRLRVECWQLRPHFALACRTFGAQKTRQIAQRSEARSPSVTTCPWASRLCVAVGAHANRSEPHVGSLTGFLALMGFPADLFLQQPIDENLICAVCLEVTDPVDSVRRVAVTARHLRSSHSSLSPALFCHRSVTQ